MCGAIRRRRNDCASARIPTASIGYSHRLTFNEFTFDLDLVRPPVKPARQIDEHLDSDLAHLVMRQHKSGERRMRELRDRPVVEPDDGNVVGTFGNLLELRGFWFWSFLGV